MRRMPVYGLDIETDTSVDGLDPATSRIVTVALSGSIDEIFDGPEDELLAALDARLANLAPGVFATWNGSAFDIPFIADRADLWGLRLGLVTRPDPSIVLPHGPLRGHDHGYRALWYGHRHLDAYRVYKNSVGATMRISCSLKSIARFVGLTPVEVDRSRIHDLSREALHAYAASDARLARVLTERKWSTASRCVDRLPPTSPSMRRAAPSMGRGPAPGYEVGTSASISGRSVGPRLAQS